MKKQYLRLLIALVGLAGFGFSAKAQSVDQLVVKVPFEFVVSGKTLPAGTYTVSRASSASIGGVLVLSSFENRTGALVLPIEFETGSVDKVYLGFEQVGDQYFLSEIRTADHLFTISVSKKSVMAAKTQGGAPASGSMSGNN